MTIQTEVVSESRGVGLVVRTGWTAWDKRGCLVSLYQFKVRCFGEISKLLPASRRGKMSKM